MVKCIVYLLINTCFLIVHSAKILDPYSYLDDKSIYLENSFKEKARLFYKRDSDTITIKDYEESLHPEMPDYIKMLLLTNSTHILTKKGIFEKSNNSTIFLQQIGEDVIKISENNNIPFVKNIIFNDIGFIIINSGIKGDSYIYQYTNGSFNLVQTIWTPNAIDGHFFVNNNNLYLVIANNKENSLAETTIYKWLGFHFDEIQMVFTTGAIKVGSFTTRTAEIIIILQDTPNKAFPSAVFEFCNEIIKKIQLIKPYHPTALKIFSNENKNYVIIFARNRKNIIYEWKDFELKFLNEFHTADIIDNSEIFQPNGTSLLAIPFCDNLELYQLINGKIKLVEKINYVSNFTKILDIQKGKNWNIHVAGLNEKNVTKLTTIYWRFNFIERGSNLSDENVIRQCFIDLETKVINRKTKLGESKKFLSQMKPEVIVAESLLQEPAIENHIEELKMRLDKISSIMNYYTIPTNKNLIINGPVTFKNSVNAKEITANNAFFKNINGQKWSPEQWLRYTQPQTISGPSKIKTVTADYLETSSTDPLFKELLLKNGDQEINGSISIDSLSVPKIYAKNINGVHLEGIYYKSKPAKIKGGKKFKYQNVEDDDMDNISEDEADVIIMSPLTSLPDLDLESNITIENLEVETINGIDWETFKNSVFRINITEEIKGPLTFSKLKTKQLHVKKIKNIDVDDLLTTSTDQVIDSNLKFNQIFASQIKADTINGIRIPEDVVLVNQSNTIQGPVKFDRMKVLGNLTLSDKIDGSFNNSDDHIIGTKVSDLFQIYSGKVTVHGDVHLRNLKLLPNTKFLISGKNVNTNFTDVYWTKNTHQKIPVEVKFLQGVTSPHLLTEVLNNVKFSQYLLNDNEDKLETDFKFENVTVVENVVLRDTAKHKPDLNKLLKEAVHSTGSYIIHGKKTYLNTLKAENLETLELEGIKVNEALNTKWPLNVTGNKYIKNLTVKTNVRTNISNIKTINGVSLEKFLQSVIFIDKPTNITHLDFENLNVENLYFQKINDHPLVDYYPLQEKLQNTSLITNLTIKGNVSISHAKNMMYLNDMSYTELLKNTFRVGKNGIVDGVVFTGKIKVKNFKANRINNISFKNLTKRALNRHLAQTIKAPYNFINLKADNIVTKKINDVSVENLINTRSDLPQKIYFPNGSLSLTSDVEMVYLRASKITPCDLKTLDRELSDPPTQKWKYIEIKGNVTLLDEETFLYRLFEKSVKMNSRNVIHSDVNIASHVLIKNLHINNHINGLDILYLLEDAVLKKSIEEQKITGKKWFTTLETREAHVLENSNTEFINNENISAFNSDIVDKNGDKIIRGKKTFYSGLQTKKFNSKLVSGVSPENIVNLDESKVVPEATIDTIHIRGNIDINIYNRTNFKDFIRKRLLTNGPATQLATGIYFFDKLESYNFTTPDINGINIDDIVFDIGNQDIKARKYFKQPVTIKGNVSVEYINGINITDELANSIPLEGFVEINGNIIILKHSNVTGKISSESINSVPVTSIIEIISSNSTQIESEEIYFLKQQLIENINRTQPIIENLPNEYMYLEKSGALQITIPNTISASTINSNHHVLIHANGQKSGEYCGLPKDCSCPVQYFVEITPQNSITVFPNKEFHRIFNYVDEFLTVNFITNSVSMSATCRTNQSKVMNEISMMTWNTKTPGNAAGLFYQDNKLFGGYISKVVFFTLDGNTYAVVGRYYDPVINSYELDCTVLKFNENKTKALPIQSIPTKGIQEVYLFPTAQGMVLVLGNQVPNGTQSTQILRFESAKDQFVSLRIIPWFGCSSAIGLVQGSDSLIALSHKETPVQVLKYYPEYDSYYYYESFELDVPVIGMSLFYAGDFGMSDAYLCLITSDEKYYIYLYRFVEGFKLKSTGELEGLRNFATFNLNKQTYLFASSAEYSFLLSVVKNGSK